jgi:hypothetical protein
MDHPMPTVWPGRSDTGSILLPMNPPSRLSATLALAPAPLPLVRKHEFHLTLLSGGEAGALAARMPEAAWREAFDALDWRARWQATAELLHEPRADGDRWSVIQHLELPALNAWRRALAAASDLALPDTLPHVTLMVAGSPRGIGLPSLAEHAARRVRALTADELALLNIASCG